MLLLCIPCISAFTATLSHGVHRHARTAAPHMKAVDVSDLGITMEDLEKPIEMQNGLDISATGVESTSGTNDDGGISWEENSAWMKATIKIPGLMGQPAESLNVALTENTMSVQAFGMQVWSCVLKGTINPEVSQPRTKFEGAMGAVPTITVELSKPPGAERWNGLVGSVGVDSILQ